MRISWIPVSCRKTDRRLTTAHKLPASTRRAGAEVEPRVHARAGLADLRWTPMRFALRRCQPGADKSASSVLSFYYQMSAKNDQSLVLRERACERIRSGKLPTRTPSSVWGGSGNGARCAVCDENLSHDELEVEFDVTPQDGQKGGTYRMHVSCYTAWKSELLDGSACAACSETTKSSRLGGDAIHESETSIGRSG